jgi:hypothetical protein
MKRYAAIALTIVALVVVMLNVQGAHRFATSSAVMPVILVAIVAEQMNRRRGPQASGRRLLFAVQVTGFILGTSMLVAAGILRQ